MQGALGIVHTTGNFGPVTEARLREWQRRHALVPDGIAGPKTWAKIDGAKGAVPVSGSRSATMAAQEEASVSVEAIAENAVILPVADDSTHPVTADKRRAYTPQGIYFARRVGRGFQSLGHTGVDGYVASRPDAGMGLSPSRLAAVVAVMGNEGKLEAVNSYDNSFMSFGIMQVDGRRGRRGRRARGAPRAVAGARQRGVRRLLRLFSVSGARASEGEMYGRLTFEGNELNSARDKAFLRGSDWAYRFWRAGHHPSVRRCQIVHAGERARFFAGKDIRGHAVGEWITSELGMTLLLDQHVNRPGHVVGTLDKALGGLLDQGAVPGRPADWSDDHEDLLIDRYVAERARTNMTHALARATRMFNLAEAGKLSSSRGSFA